EEYQAGRSPRCAGKTRWREVPCNRSGNRFGANSLRRVGLPRAADFGLSASVERTGDKIASTRRRQGAEQSYNIFRTSCCNLELLPVASKLHRAPYRRETRGPTRRGPLGISPLCPEPATAFCRPDLTRRIDW